jgi:tRNA threonylcarbamoyladenosine biosynthesis protein TsaB
MSLILSIDTAFETASVCLAKDGEILQSSESGNHKEHASWLHPAIAAMLKNNGSNINELNAVAINIGPGSYTGLRVGLAAAKGFCFALNIPLIAINSLKILAYAVQDKETAIICPVIDARRMEVFTAVYNKMLQEIKPPYALVLDENSFSSLFSEGKVLFCGNAVEKLQTVISNNNAIFSNTMANATHLARLSFSYFERKKFADLAYTEPLYVKEFYSPVNSR